MYIHICIFFSQHSLPTIMTSISGLLHVFLFPSTILSVTLSWQCQWNICFHPFQCEQTDSTASHMLSFSALFIACVPLLNEIFYSVLSLSSLQKQDAATMSEWLSFQLSHLALLHHCHLTCKGVAPFNSLLCPHLKQELLQHHIGEVARLTSQLHHWGFPIGSLSKFHFKLSWSSGQLLLVSTVHPSHWLAAAISSIADTLFGSPVLSHVDTDRPSSAAANTVISWQLPSNGWLLMHSFTCPPGSSLQESDHLLHAYCRQHYPGGRCCSYDGGSHS